MIEIGVADVADQKFSLLLNNRRVSMRLRFNHTSNRWAFDLSIDGDAVIHGRRIVTGVDLIQPFNLGIGAILAYSKINSDPGRQELPSGAVKLYHVTKEELNAAVAA